MCAECAARRPGSFADDPDDESNRRYVDGQRLYFAECSPWQQATWILDNADLDNPWIGPPRSDAMRD